MPFGVRDLDSAAIRLFDRSSRVVGWGSGSVFDYFHSQFPVRLDYLVDNDAGRWGQQRRGIAIADPDRLRDEDPATTFVIIYSSAWPEIQQQLQTMGRIPSLAASAICADATTRARLAWCETIAAAPAPLRRPHAQDTIVVQGPVIAGVTARALRVMSANSPNSLVVLSTWSDTRPDLLAEVRGLADDVVFSARPACMGVQNRNAQLVSTSAGIERAIEHGAVSILKTRTDLAVMAPSVFDQARWWLDRVGGDSARAVGLSGRLIVPSSFTRKFLLYHPSDLVMLGGAEDMRLYWSAPLDARSGDLLSPERLDRSVASVNMEGNPTESYFGLEFCRRLGRPAPGTLRDSWAFYRDLFAVVDNDWFDLLWFKNLSIPDLAVRRGLRQMVTQAFWQRLDAADPTLEREIDEVDPEQVSLRLLAGAAA